MKRCLMLLVALATIPSTYALPTGEFPIAARPTGFAPYDRRNVMVAATDTIALVAWEDFRVDPNQPPRVWATRIKLFTGEVMDTTGIQIAALPALEGSALRAVGTDGNDFVVAWTENFRIKLAHITSDTGAIAHRVETGIQGEKMAIASDGISYFAFFTFVSQKNFPSSSVNMLTLDRNAAVLGRVDGVVSGSDGVLDVAASITPNKANVILAWPDTGDGQVHVAAFPAGPLRGGIFTHPLPAFPVFPKPITPPVATVASSGSEIFAVWFQRPSTIYRAQRFDMGGFPIGAAFDVEPAFDDPATDPRPSVVWDGSNYVVALEARDGSLQAVRYASNGARVDITPLFITGRVSGLSMWPSGTGPVLAWLTPGTAGAQVGADQLLPSGQSRFNPGHLSLSTGFVDRSEAVAVWRGDHYLAAWRDQSNVSRTVIGRISANGVPLDGDGIEASVGTAGSPPVLASNGHTAVVAWHDSSGVSASLVDETGHVFRRMFDFPGGQPSVNWNGQQYVVMWRSSQGQLLALRMTGPGALIDNDPVNVGVPLTGDPVVGWTGNSYVVAWAEFAPLPVVPAPVAIFAQFVSSTLHAIGSRIQVSNAIGLTETLGTPIVGDSGDGALIVWTHTGFGATATELRGARARNGAILDSVNGFPIGEGSNATIYPSNIGWGVVSGANLFNVSVNGTVHTFLGEFPFVPAGSRAFVALGGPAPLVLYRRPPQGTEQAVQVVARYVIPPQRERPARH